MGSNWRWAEVGFGSQKPGSDPKNPKKPGFWVPAKMACRRVLADLGFFERGFGRERGGQKARKRVLTVLGGFWGLGVKMAWGPMGGGFGVGLGPFGGVYKGS